MFKKRLFENGIADFRLMFIIFIRRGLESFLRERLNYFYIYIKKFRKIF
jgi:hypothetical protein